MSDEETGPFAGKKYQLKVGELVREGVTTHEGKLAEEVPVTAEDGVLTIWLNDQDPDDTLIWPLKIGHLDPLEEISGIQGRLNNLGFFCGKVDGLGGERTEAALKAFQTRHGLPVNGHATPETLAKLKEIHGS